MKKIILLLIVVTYSNAYCAKVNGIFDSNTYTYGGIIISTTGSGKDDVIAVGSIVNAEHNGDYLQDTYFAALNHLGSGQKTILGSKVGSEVSRGIRIPENINFSTDSVIDFGVSLVKCVAAIFGGKCKPKSPVDIEWSRRMYDGELSIPGLSKAQRLFKDLMLD